MLVEVEVGEHLLLRPAHQDLDGAGGLRELPLLEVVGGEYIALGLAPRRQAWGQLQVVGQVGEVLGGGGGEVRGGVGGMEQGALGKGAGTVASCLKTKHVITLV